MLIRILRRLPLLLIFGLVSCVTKPVLRGELHGQLFWQGEVHLQGNLILAKDAVLTIAPGTHVVFLPLAAGEDDKHEHPYFPGSELIVRGRISAIGTADAPIQFRYIDPQGRPGSWGGINIEGSPQAHFEYSVFTQADSAVHSRDSWVVVENSHFHGNLVGIRFHDSNILIEKNLLENNGAAIRFHFGAPVICKNIIRNNSKGLFITSEPREYAIENNSFLHNHPYEVNLGEGVRKPVLLKNNYWGEQTPASLPEYFYDGRLDDWLGTVDYLPMRTTPDPDAGGVWRQ